MAGMRNSVLMTMVALLSTDGDAKLTEPLSYTSTGVVKQHLISDKLGDINRLLLSVRGCKSAVLILSQNKDFLKDGEKYFSVKLGLKVHWNKDSYRLNGLQDSCIRCSTLNNMALKTTMSCDKFHSFYITWDNHGYIEMGDESDIRDGKKAEKMPFLQYQSKSNFSLNFLHVFSIKVKVEWRFSFDVEEKPTIEDKGNRNDTISDIPEQFAQHTGGEDAPDRGLQHKTPGDGVDERNNTSRTGTAIPGNTGPAKGDEHSGVGGNSGYLSSVLIVGLAVIGRL